MKYLLVPIFLLLSTLVFGQGSSIEIEGAIILNDQNTSTPIAGMIRWNTNTKDFEGYNGSIWISLTALSSNSGNWGSSGPFTYEDHLLHSPLPENNATFGREVSCENQYSAISSLYQGQRAILLYENELLIDVIDEATLDNNPVPRNFDISNGLLIMGSDVLFEYNISTKTAQVIKIDSTLLADDPGYGFAYDQNHILPTTEGHHLYHVYNNNGVWEDRGVIWDTDFVSNQAVSNNAVAFLTNTGIEILEFENDAWKKTATIELEPGYLLNYFDLQNGRLAVTFSDFTSADPFQYRGLINIYDQSNDWSLTESIANPDIGEPFGQIAIQGNTIIAHTELIFDDDQSIYNGQGKIHVYELSSGNWLRTAILTSSDGRNSDWFGWGAFPRINNIDLTEDRIVIGCRNAEIKSGIAGNDDHGKAYVYYRNND